MPLNRKLEINLSPNDSKKYIDENDLYNPDGIEIFYGYKGDKKYAYGDEDDVAFGGIEQTGGLHGIHLSRPLSEGERVILHWRNNYDLIIFCKGGKTRVKKRIGGTYQEIGKWADENGNSEYTTYKFKDDIYTKRFDYIETENFKEF